MDNKKKPSGAFKSKQRQERKDIKQNCPKLYEYNPQNSTSVKFVPKASQWRKIGSRVRRRKGRGALNLRIASFAGNSERRSFVRCTVPTIGYSYPSSLRHKRQVPLLA
ncbi:hypothetical protein EVAR_20442_1 [Eumeta japonica]|uniref:Uncharacterized protein n=1 Tax=Eumeta variegata TaxID=151549 RepID=A0A4C1TY32_EUMVA|nr:hypothetical protein EVAR_20442_1 [Eumeta japonica]